MAFCCCCPLLCTHLDDYYDEVVDGDQLRWEKGICNYLSWEIIEIKIWIWSKILVFKN